jgi:hypothetical protein
MIVAHYMSVSKEDLTAARVRVDTQEPGATLPGMCAAWTFNTVTMGQPGHSVPGQSGHLVPLPWGSLDIQYRGSLDI